MSTYFQPLCSDVGLSKAEILEDILCCISEAFTHVDCDFNDSGAWSGYGAHITIEMTLHDVDDTRVEKTLKVGEPEEPLTKTVVEAFGASPSAVRERIEAPAPSLEAGAQAPKRRWYAPRHRKTTANT